MNVLTVPTLVLRDTQSFFARVRLQERLGELIGSLAGATAVFLALFGAMIGAFHSPLQLMASAVKLPLLFLATLLITFPTLYVFNILFGARYSMRQYFSLLLGTTAINSVLLLGFAPIGILFMMTTDNYLSFKMINVLMFAISGIVAMRFFYQGMSLITQQEATQLPNHLPGSLTADAGLQSDSAAAFADATAQDAIAEEQDKQEPGRLAATTAKRKYVEGLNTEQDQAPQFSTAAEKARYYRKVPSGRTKAQQAEAKRPEIIRRRILKLWVILYALVGSQLAWTLKPFFGDPAVDFILFDDTQGGFFIDILNTLGKMILPDKSY